VPRFRRTTALLGAVAAAVVLVTGAGGSASAGPHTAASATASQSVFLRTPARVIYPARTQVTVVVSSGSSPVRGATVRIYGKPAGASGYVPQYTATTNDNGAVAVSLWIGSSTWYFASAESASFSYTTSLQRLVPLYPRLGIGTMSTTTIARGHTLMVTGTLLPAGFHEFPTLQVNGPNQPYHWVATASSCDRFGHWTLSWKVPANRTAGTVQVRSVLPANQFHAQATSSSRTLVVT
jgi:hypothetical protein